MPTPADVSPGPTGTRTSLRASPAAVDHVPKALTVLWAIFLDNRQFACTEIIELSLRIRHWMRIERGRSGMNRTFASWRVRSPAKLAAMIECLNRPEAEVLFALHGAGDVLEELRQGLADVVRGERAEIAFGPKSVVGNRGEGRPSRGVPAG
jgi:hypothetical protein